MMWAYHGTHTGNLESIVHEGLRAPVYFSEYRNSADFYASGFARKPETYPLVVRFPWPDDAVPNPDLKGVPEGDRPTGEYLTRTPVPPERLQVWNWAEERPRWKPVQARGSQLGRHIQRRPDVHVRGHRRRG